MTEHNQEEEIDAAAESPLSPAASRPTDESGNAAGQEPGPGPDSGSGSDPGCDSGSGLDSGSGSDPDSDAGAAAAAESAVSPGQVEPPADGGRQRGRSESARGSSSGPSRQRGERLMLVRYGKMGFLGLFRHSEREISPTAEYVIVHTERGLEIARILTPYYHPRGNCMLSGAEIEGYCRASGSNYPFSYDGRFVRFATDQDLNEQRHMNKSAREEMKYCQELIGRLKLPMHLVDVEHLFGGDRIIYYFMAEGRVDFRQLVKDLAQRYQTRIEMRQIGARDEARLVADFETCGRQCCCKNFLKVLQPVSMRMAKLQKATLDPSKISGRCGRLKCCLRYEDAVYNQLCKKLPRINSWVQTEQGPGQVLEAQVLTQLVKLRLQSGRIIAVAIEEIQKRDLAPPSADRPAPAGPTPPAAPVKTAAAAPKAVGSDEADPSAEAAAAKKRRRRRRRKKKPSEESSSLPASES